MKEKRGEFKLPPEFKDVLKYLLPGAALIILLSLLAPGFIKSFLFFVLFVIIWAILIIVLLLSIKLIWKIILWGTIISGLISLYLFFGAEKPDLGFPLFFIALLGLIFILAAIAAALIPIVGPAFLAGEAVYHALGKSGFAEFLGFLTFCMVAAIMYAIFLKIIMPFLLGAGISMIAGSLSYNITRLIFQAGLFAYYSRQPERLDSISDIFDLIKWALYVDSAYAFLIIIGSIAIGILLVKYAWQESDEDSL